MPGTGSGPANRGPPRTLSGGFGRRYAERRLDRDTGGTDRPVLMLGHVPVVDEHRDDQNPQREGQQERGVGLIWSEAGTPTSRWARLIR